MFDMDHQISSVQRQLGSRMLAAGEARVMTVSQTYGAPIDDVWDACTNPERIPRWFLPISGDLRPGGRYQLTGNAEGTIERCDPPRSFAATWEYGGEVSWIEVRLAAEAGERTRFELEHVAHVDDKMWAEFGPGATGVGWDSTLLGLAMHLTPGVKAITPEQAPAWVASDEGRRFMSESSQRWYEVNVATGTDKAAARAAADRVTAAYTATPEE